MPSYQQMASVLADITKNANTDGGPLTPKTLIDTYCQPGMQSYWSNKESEQSKFHAGFCGYDGHKGFDDGYDWLNDLEESGWHAEHRTGKWPYIAQMIWAALPADPRYAIAHYCEGDFAVETFPASKRPSRGCASSASTTRPPDTPQSRRGRQAPRREIDTKEQQQMNTSQRPKAAQKTTYPKQRTVLDDGTVYTPFLADGMPGLQCTRPGSPTEYIYFNPSDHTDGDVPNVFVYQGPEGHPCCDTPIHHYTIWPNETQRAAKAPSPRRLRGALTRLRRDTGRR